MPFPFSFFLKTFFLSLSPFSVSPFLFVSSFFVCFLCRLLRFSSHFPDLLAGGFCSFVSVLRTPPPALLASLQVCAFLLCAVFFLLLFIYFNFLLFLPFFRFRFGRRLFHFVFSSCGCYAVSSVSVSVATRLAHDMYLIRAYVR